MTHLSPYCIFCIARAEVDVMFDESISDGIRGLRWAAIQEMPSYLMPYARESVAQKLIDAVCEKKLGFIMKATTMEDVRKIMRPALPEKTYSGIVCNSPYHIPEEELLIWAHISPCCKLLPEASERCFALFEQIYGCSIHNYEGEKKNDR